MRALFLVFALHGGGSSRSGGEHPAGDRWFAADKAKHFFMAAFVQSVSFSAIRAAGVSRGGSLAGASAATAAVSIGKELYDRRSGGTASWKDLTWDAAGLLVASTMLHQTKP